tara:strand:- start:1857 stop:2456 length:600 start_codon:yes stop_codon:yes gene_type:complete
MEEVGKRFCDIIDAEKIKLTGEQDGRKESDNSEINITTPIREQCKDLNILPKSDNRAFGDISLECNGKVEAINVKMVNPKKTTTFNGGSVNVFWYILFGKYSSVGWEKLGNEIKKNRPTKCLREYYYLIYFKNSLEKSICCGLTDISGDSIIINPSNPIQLKTKLKLVKRSEQEKVDFMIGLFEKFIKKRAAPYLSYFD